MCVLSSIVGRWRSRFEREGNYLKLLITECEKTLSNYSSVASGHFEEESLNKSLIKQRRESEIRTMMW